MAARVCRSHPHFYKWPVKGKPEGSDIGLGLGENGEPAPLEWSPVAGAPGGAGSGDRDSEAPVWYLAKDSSKWREVTSFTLGHSVQLG